MIRRREIAAGLTVMVAFVVAAVVLANAWQARTDRQQATRDTTQATALALRLAALNYQQDIDRWHELRRGCNRSVADRQLLLAQARASYTANRIVSTDPRQPDRTRRARSAEAQAYWQAILGYRKRVPPVFSCVRAFPKPLAPPGVTTLP